MSEREKEREKESGREMISGGAPADYAALIAPGYNLCSCSLFSGIVTYNILV